MLEKPGFADLYELAPLAEVGDPDGLVADEMFDSVVAALAFLRAEFPGHNYQMVNFGVLVDEYRDLVGSGGSD